MICLQSSDNNFGGGNVSSNVFYEPGGFSRCLSSIPSVIKIALEAINV